VSQAYARGRRGVGANLLNALSCHDSCWYSFEYLKLAVYIEVQTLASRPFINIPLPHPTNIFLPFWSRMFNGYVMITLLLPHNLHI